MKKSAAVAIALAALFPAAAVAQECAAEFAAIEKQITGAALQAEYRGRETAHPMVLQLADGEVVDLTGMIIIATPYESWLGDRPVVDKVGGFLAAAKPLIEAGSEEECMAQLEQARAEIQAFEDASSPSGDEAAATAAPEETPEAMEEEPTGAEGESASD
jgi:hypothetical protein